MDQLRSWALSAVDAMSGGPDRECYFSMTGGPGHTGLWAWHAASERAVHRIDVEAALGHDHAISPTEAADAGTYVAQNFLPAMRRATGIDPGSLTVELLDEEGGVLERAAIESDAGGEVTVRGPALEVMLAMFGRPRAAESITHVSGDAEVWEGWKALPGVSHQFGTWD